MTLVRTLRRRAGFGSVRVRDPALRARLLREANPQLLLPHFLVIGAQKAASTFLHRCLAAHEAVYLPDEEVPLFEDPYFGSEGLDAFRLVFPPDAAARMRGIKRPDYLARPEVPPRVKEHVPSARLLVVLRHPLSRAVAAYFHYVRLGFLPLRPPNEGLAELARGEVDPRHPRGADVVSYSLYGRHLGRWLELFPREQVLVLFQSDVARDPEPALTRAAAFLGIAPAFSRRQMRARELPTVYSLRRLRLIRTLNRLKLEHSEDRMQVYNRPGLLPKAVWAAGMAADRLLLAPLLGGSDRGLDPDVAEALMAVLRPDVAELERLLGRELPDWKEVPPGAVA